MPKGTKTLGKNKARAWESLGLEHKKRGCAYFDTPSFFFLSILQIEAEYRILLEVK